MEELRNCTHCGASFPLSNFYKRGSGREGFFSTCKRCTAVISKIYRHTKKGREVVRKCRKTQWDRIKQDAFNRLGRRCLFCGDNHFNALTIDHINKDGAKERGKKSSGNTYYGLYKRIAQDIDAPKKYQVLCMKCNWLRRYESDEEIIARYGNKK